MGQFTLTINYDDAKEAELIEALRDHYGQVTVEGPQGEPSGSRELTPAELRDRLEVTIQKQVRKLFKTYKLKTIDDSLD